MADERIERLRNDCSAVSGSAWGIARVMRDDLRALLTNHDDLEAVADRCGRREGETVAELIKRLHDETLDDED